MCRRAMQSINLLWRLQLEKIHCIARGAPAQATMGPENGLGEALQENGVLETIKEGQKFPDLLYHLSRKSAGKMRLYRESYRDASGLPVRMDIA